MAVASFVAEAQETGRLRHLGSLCLQHALGARYNRGSGRKGGRGMTTIRKSKGEAGTLYKVLFVDQQGPASTRDTYLACLLPFFAFLSETGCAWNAAPEQVRLTLIDFYRKRLGCLIRASSRTRTHRGDPDTRDPAAGEHPSSASVSPARFLPRHER
jgi:hypothetical protein